MFISLRKYAHITATRWSCCCCVAKYDAVVSILILCCLVSNGLAVVMHSYRVSRSRMFALINIPTRTLCVKKCRYCTKYTTLVAGTYRSTTPSSLKRLLSSLKRLVLLLLLQWLSCYLYSMIVRVCVSLCVSMCPWMCVPVSWIAEDTTLSVPSERFFKELYECDEYYIQQRAPSDNTTAVLQ